MEAIKTVAGFRMISTVRKNGEDASQAAARVARGHGLKLTGRMYWRGAIGPQYQEINTTDRINIRVYP